MKYRAIKTNLDFLLVWTENLKAEIQDLPYGVKDVRKDYFKTSYSNVYHYYIGYINLLKSHLLSDERLAFLGNVEPFTDHIERLREIATKHTLLQGYINTLNQRVFVMAWSLFELSISTFYEAVVDSKELNRQYREIHSEVSKNVVIKEGRELRLEKILVNESLHSIPILRKCNYLFKIANGKYSTRIEDDKEFLYFFGKLRNTMHSNFIYYGKDYEFRFGHAKFLFRNKKLVVWNDPFDTMPVPCVKLYVYLIGELNRITKELFNSIEFADIIEYPDPEAE